MLGTTLGLGRKAGESGERRGKGLSRAVCLGWKDDCLYLELCAHCMSLSPNREVSVFSVRFMIHSES